MANTIETLTDEERRFLEAQRTSDPHDEFAKALRIIDAQPARILRLEANVLAITSSANRFQKERDQFSMIAERDRSRADHFEKALEEVLRGVR